MNREENNYNKSIRKLREKQHDCREALVKV